MNETVQLKVKYKSSPNIAWVKYWGKYDQQYILPINDSLGITLNSDDIYTQTTITFSSDIPQNTIILNNTIHPISKRITKMFELIKNKAYTKKYSQQISKEKWDLYHFKINSYNSFPTASGMASSASGLACLAVGLNGLFGGIMSQGELSELARLGSGSACRSVYGGLVRWKGVPENIITNNIKPDTTLLQKLSKQCISFTTIAHQHLKSIKILILLATNKQKQISSTAGMATSVKTSQLIKYRNGIANRRIQQILSCLKQLQSSTITKQKQHQLYNSIMENIIRDSNQFHAICLDTYPPIFYLNQFSKQIIHIVDNLINPYIDYKVAYTFDAGPHAFLFVHQKNQAQILKYFYDLFEIGEKEDKVLNKKARDILKSNILSINNQNKLKKYQGNVIKPYQIWSTSVGSDAYKIQ